MEERYQFHGKRSQRPFQRQSRNQGRAALWWELGLPGIGTRTITQAGPGPQSNVLGSLRPSRETDQIHEARESIESVPPARPHVVGTSAPAPPVALLPKPGGQPCSFFFAQGIGPWQALDDEHILCTTESVGCHQTSIMSPAPPALAIAAHVTTAPGLFNVSAVPDMDDIYADHERQLDRLVSAASRWYPYR